MFDTVELVTKQQSKLDRVPRELFSYVNLCGKILSPRLDSMGNETTVVVAADVVVILVVGCFFFENLFTSGVITLFLWSRSYYLLALCFWTPQLIPKLTMPTAFYVVLLTPSSEATSPGPATVLINLCPLILTNKQGKE